jgi:hypothetical protein
LHHGKQQTAVIGVMSTSLQVSLRVLQTLLEIFYGFLKLSSFDEHV